VTGQYARYIDRERHVKNEGACACYFLFAFSFLHYIELQYLVFVCTLCFRYDAIVVMFAS